MAETLETDHRNGSAHVGALVLCPTEERSENEITNCERLPVGHGADINHLSRHDL